MNLCLKKMDLNRDLEMDIGGPPQAVFREYRILDNIYLPGNYFTKSTFISFRLYMNVIGKITNIARSLMKRSIYV